MMSRPQSANEYGLGYRMQVVPLLRPESPPPPPPPPPTYIETEQVGVRRSSSLRRLGRSVDCDLPQHVAEKFRKFAAGQPKEHSRPESMLELDSLLRPMIPTISIDDDGGPVLPPSRKPSLASISTFAPSETNSFTTSLDRGQFASTRIQWLVNAFTDRARAIKTRITQPATPSTESSSQGELEAPGPPPLSLRPNPTPSDNGDAKSFRFQIPSTFHPQSSFYIAWLFVVTMAFFYNLWCIPLRAWFPYQDPENVYHWLTVDYLADFVYLVDTVYVRPRMRFVHDGSWIDNVAECGKNYIRTLGFKVDVLSLTPLDFLYFYFGLDTPLLRVPRMIRILPFWELFDRLDVIVSSPFIIRIGRTLFYMIYLIHLNACAYYVFSESVGIGTDTFVFQGDGNAYIRCFYFALKTATKIGKNPKPVNNIDRTFMIFNWLIGVFACAAIIGQMRDIMAAADKSVNEYRESVDRTVQFMNRLHLPADVQNRVRMWFSYSWSTQKSLDEKSSLVFLPHNMQLEIALNVHFHTLSKVQLFQDCDQGLLRDLVLKLKPVLFLPGDLVCKKGEVGKEMYIVKSGQVQVMGGPNNDIVLVTLSEGSVFGEISLLAAGGQNRRMADVRSKGFSNLFVLSKSDLNEALQDHPEAQKILRNKAKRMIKKTSKRQLLEESQPIISTNAKPPTPKLVKTILRAVAPDSKTSQFLLRGSRASLRQLDDTTPNEAENTSSHISSASKPTLQAVEREDGRACSDSLLLKPEQLDRSNKRPMLSGTKLLFPGFSNRIVPCDTSETPPPINPGGQNEEP